jgi:tetratricopeptide (TPR) repeat protein
MGAVQTASLVGRKLGNYEIGTVLGEGGMGTVYRARTLKEGPAGPAGSIVALKVFHPDLVSDEVTFRRFQREAELGMRIRHGNVVQTYEIGSEAVEGTTYHFMAMELVEGQTARGLIQEMGTVPEHLIYLLADQALDALSAVHQQGMVHRDLKPENLVLTPEHRLLLMDLGVARLQQEGRDLTRAGEFVGSLAYAAPEQFLDQDHVGPQADIYALGVVMYEMATGRNPFGAAELSTVLTQKVKGLVRRPRLVQRDMEPFLEEVILTCLRQDPAERFKSCDEMREVLRTGEVGEWWKKKTAGGAFPAAAKALKRLRPPREAPLVGRGTDLDALHQAYEAARGGEARVIFLAGARGVGKSRLVHDFLEELLAPDGPIVLAGRCVEQAGPYHAIVEGLTDYLGDDEAKLATLLPDAASAAPNVARFLAGGDGAAAFATAFPTLLRNLATGRPVILCVEDLQLAGPETLELLSLLVRTLRDEAVLLLATFRPEEVVEGSSLHTLLAAVGQRPGAMTLQVAPLGRDAAEELVRSIVRHGRTVRALGRVLYERTDGNPLLLLEMIAHLRAEGALVPAEEGFVLTRPVEKEALPSGARDLLLAALAGLDEAQRELLEAAAVQGPEFEPGLLATVSGQRRIQLLKSLALLERKHRVIASAGRDAFRFASRGLHHVVYDAIEPARRRELHGKCADALAEGSEGAPGAYARVRHLLLAGRLAEAPSEILQGAFEHASHHLHPGLAAEFLESVVASLGDAAAAAHFDALMQLATLHEMLGRREARMAALEQARAEAERLGGPGPRARVHMGLAAAVLRAGGFDRARDEAAKGLELAREAKDRAAETGCLHASGAILHRRGDYANACARFEEALALERDAGDKRGEAHTLQALGAVLGELGDAARAVSAKEEALRIFREVGDRRGESAALNNLGNSRVEALQLEEALLCYEQASKIAREVGDLPAESAALYNEGRALAALARIDEAKDCFTHALDIYREIGDPAGEAEVLDDLGVAIAPYGEMDEALAHLEAARTLAQRTGQRPLHARALRHLANLLHARGDRKRAWRHYEEALALAGAHGRCLTRADMGNAALNEEDHDRAVRLLQESLTEGPTGSRALLTLCRLSRAHKAAGRGAEAQDCARRAEKMLEDLGALPPQYGPEIYYSLGTTFEAGEGARQYLAKANELLGARSRSIRSMVRRHHYLTMTWPNREILEEARRLFEG